LKFYKLIESKYNIEIKDEEIKNIITLADLVKIIKIKQLSK
jgi:acyl carrier protein